MEGDYIVFEGADGAGTTTVSQIYADENDAYWVKEPADNRIGRKVDEMINQDYSAEAVALAFAADRMTLYEEEIEPRLEQGTDVVSDRSYISSVVYQALSGVDRDWLVDINQEMPKPDEVILLDVTPEIGLERVSERNQKDDFERLPFQKAVTDRYKKEVRELHDNWKIVDADASLKTVVKQVLE